MALFGAAAGLVVGLALGQTLRLSVLAVAAVVLLPLFAILLARRQRPILVGAFFGLGIAAGLLRVASGATPAMPMWQDAHLGTEVTVAGTVVGEPVPRNTTVRLYLEVTEIRGSGNAAPIQGGLVAWVDPRMAAGLFPGDRVALTGKLDLPPTFPDFDYRAALMGRGISAAMLRPQIEVLERGKGPTRWLAQTRRVLGRSLDRGLPEPEAALARALLLGQRGGLTQDLEEEWARAGTVHILSISGLHVGVLLGVLVAASSFLFGRRRYIYLIVPFAAVWAYAILAGLDPPIQRAAFMGSMYLVAIGLGRQSSGGLSLVLAAAVLAFIDPSVLGQVPFQLSFAAMAGLVYLAPPLQQAFSHATGAQASDGLSGLITTGAAASVGATLAVVPLLSYHFGVTSLVGLPATLLALPALPVQLVTAALAAFLGLAGEVPAQIGGWLAWPWLAYLLGISSVFARLPFAAVMIGALGPSGVLTAYAVGILLLWGPLFGRTAGLLGPVALGPAMPPGGDRGVFSLSILGLLVIMDVVLLIAVARDIQGDRLLRVTILDVGQGDAILVQAPGGRRILVDGGPSGQVLERRLAEEVPWWSRRIDAVLLTHGQTDHVGGLAELLERRPVGAVLETGLSSPSAAYALWQAALADGVPPAYPAIAGLRIDLGRGALLEVLHPPERPLLTRRTLDDNAAVVRVTYGRSSFLLTGDVFAAGEEYLLAQGVPIQATVLKVSHHGSGGSTTPVFLDAVGPTLAVISVGIDNSFGQPSPEVVARLVSKVGKEGLFRTDQDGTVRFTTDGERLWMETSRSR